jgi:tetratricopeptide (TPR) repeat protein
VRGLDGCRRCLGSGGHPQLLEAALAGWTASGHVQPRDGVWTAVAALDAGPGLRHRLVDLASAELSALRRRQPHLAHELLALLQLLAIAEGPQPWPWLEAALARLALDPGRLRACLAVSTEAGLLLEDRASGSLSLRHPALAEALLRLDGLPRPALHRALAFTLQDAGLPRQRYVPHLWRAGELREAWLATQQGVQAAERFGANDAIDRLLAEAEHFAEPAGLLSPEPWAWALTRRGQALLSLSRYTQAAMYFEELRAVACTLTAPADADADTEALLGLAAVAEACGRFPVALAHLDLVTRTEPWVVHRAEALRGHVFRGLSRPDDALAAMARAEQACLALDDPLSAARFRAERALLEVFAGRPARASSLLETMPPVVASAVDPTLRARWLYVSGNILQEQGQSDGAVQAYVAALDLLHALGHVHGELGVMGNLSIALQSAGRAEEAEAVLLRSLRMREAHVQSRGLSQTCNNLADLYLSQGRPLDALPLARRAVQAVRELGRQLGLVISLCTLAQSLAGVGDREGARAAALESLELNGDPPGRPQAAATCRRVLDSLDGRRA